MPDYRDNQCDESLLHAICTLCVFVLNLLELCKTWYPLQDIHFAVVRDHFLEAIRMMRSDIMQELDQRLAHLLKPLSPQLQPTQVVPTASDVARQQLCHGAQRGSGQLSRHSDVNQHQHQPANDAGASAAIPLAYFTLANIR